MQSTQKFERALAQARQRKQLPAPLERRLLRLRAGLSQGDVATVIGTTTAAVSRYESGHREPREAILGKYLEVLERLTRESMEPAR